MPRPHREYAEWTPKRLLEWAQQSGPQTAQLVSHILTSRRHPQQGFRSCLGILRLGKTYSSQRLEAACQRPSSNTTSTPNHFQNPPLPRCHSTTTTSVDPITSIDYPTKDNIPMLNHPILDQLLSLKLIGMHRALTEQMHMDNLEPLSFEERLGLLIDRESTERARQTPSLSTTQRSPSTTSLHRRHRLSPPPRPRQTSLPTTHQR